MYYQNENTLNEEKQKFVQELYENYKNEKETIENESPNTLLTNQAELEKLNKLDENTYYSNNLTPFNLNLYYTDTDENIEKTANFVKNSLKEL
ncbi:MAG: hypothetical protein LBQ59_03940 [Candidatus Peribacteria bacterium]|jgi:hypothetical protein|nr:hypothetical protein [Candidatus Peribacteria bacterium]